MHDDHVYLGRDDAPPGLKRLATGKVRDIYEIDDEHLLFVTTDRVSAFDVPMKQGIPRKGAVLTEIAAWWFTQTRDIVPNHLVSTSIDDVPALDDEWKRKLAGRIMVVRRCRPTAVEWVVRGYITGSGWKEYQQQGTVCGIPLPAGLQQAERLPEPILTPTTKDDDHDRPLTPDEAREVVGSRVYDRLEAASLALFARGTETLAKIGVVLADTKFEFGEQDGDLVLIDEVLTPDSSRFWPEDEYRVGISPPSYDKQILRDWLETQDWDKTPPPPDLPQELVDRIARRYLEICERITGHAPAEPVR